MLDEIVFAGAMLAHIRFQPMHDIALMVAGEDQRLALDFAPAKVDFVLLQVHEAAQNVQQRVFGENVFPQVGRAVAVGIGRVAGAVVTALVEGQEARLAAVEARGHPDFIGVYGEVNEGAALEGKERLRAGPGPP